MKGLFASAVLLAATAQAGLVPVSSVRAVQISGVLGIVAI